MIINSIGGGASGSGAAKLLWTNPNGNASFSGQSVTVSGVQNYTFIIIMGYNAFTSGTYVASGTIATEIGGSMVGNGVYSNTSRSVAVSNNTVTFGNAKANGSDYDQSVAVPYKIYGL